MKKIFIIIAAVITFSSCKHHSALWTQVYYASMYDHFYKMNGKAFTNPVQNKQFTTYEIGRLKVELPDGLSSVPADSLDRLFNKIGVAYAKTHNTDNLQMLVRWTPSAEATFKKSLFNEPFINKINEKLRNNYCDCLIMKLKEAYPGSIRIPIPDSIYLRVIGECKIAVGIK